MDENQKIYLDETRAGKYGRFLAAWVKFTIAHVPCSQDGDYRARFIAELEKYSFEPRKRGGPRNSGCNWELAGLDELDVTCPEELAKTVKEDLHLDYQKQTARKIFDSLLEHL
jgi:hypothetical protein